MRHGQQVGDLRTAEAHMNEVLGLITGIAVAQSA